MSSHKARLPRSPRRVIRGQNVQDKSTPDYDGEVALHEGRASELAAPPGAVLVDYLRAVLPDVPGTWRELRALLGEMTARGFGWRGHYDQSAAVLDGGIVAWCSRPERAEIEGVMVDLPGRACAALGDRLAFVMQWCLDRGHTTRVDWAFDDRKGLITEERIEEARRSEGIVMRWRKIKKIVTYERGKPDAWTYNLGSRSGRSYARIYDKAAQMDVPGPWVRFELETKGRLADRLARRFFEVGSEAIIGQINRRLRFCVPTGTDKNKRRWPVCEWWRQFVGSLKRGMALLAGEKVLHTIDRARRWLAGQVMPWLAAVLEADGGDLAWLSRATDRGRMRWKPHHLAALALARVPA